MEAEMPVGNHPAAPAAGPSSGQQQAMQASVAGGSSNNKVYAEVAGDPHLVTVLVAQGGR